MAEAPRIGLIGAGPVGSLLAAAFLQHPVRLTWVVRSPQRREQMGKGLALAHRGQHLALDLDSVELASDTAALVEPDRVVLAVKAQHVAPTLVELAHSPEHTLVVANGFHAGPFALGLLYGGAYLDDAGVLHCSPTNRLRYGYLGWHAPPDKLWEEVGSAPWLSAHPSWPIEPLMWHKLALNCAVNALTALLDRPNGVLAELLDSPLVTGVLEEAHAVMAADLGTDQAIPVAKLRADLQELLKETEHNSSSMREDLRLGRETEVGALNGALADRAAAHGIPAPFNAGLAEMVRRIQAGPG